MWVVVMHYVQGTEAMDILTNSMHIASLRRRWQRSYATMGWCSTILRTPNLLISEERAMLVDFYWCRKACEARHPSDILLLDTTNWHCGVERGGCILKTRLTFQTCHQASTWYRRRLVLLYHAHTLFNLRPLYHTYVQAHPHNAHV